MSEIKDIIIFYPSFERGGVTVNLINFINFTVKNNLNIYLISQTTDIKKFFNHSKKIKFVKVKKISIPFIPQRVLSSLLSIIHIIKTFKHCNKNRSILLSFQSSIIPIIVCKIFGRKVIIRNSEDAIDATKFADNKFFAYFVLFSKIIFYNFADGIITNSIKAKKSLESIVHNNKKIKLIYNPYLLRIFKRKNKKKRNLILSVGRLCKQKNFETLIRGFCEFLKKFPNYNLLILGHGYNEHKLKKMAEDLKIAKHVQFKGWVSETKKYFDTSKIFVMTSLYEGLPNVLIDAVNYEIPTISTKCSGATDILTKKEGVYFKLQDHNDLAKQMIKTASNYNNHLKKIKRTKMYLNRFLAEKQSTKYLDYCNKIF